MTSTDPAAFDGETTGTHAIPVFTLGGLRVDTPPEPEQPPALTATIHPEYPGLWFSGGRGPDGELTVYRVDDPQSLIYTPGGDNADLTNRDRHMLRALLMNVLDMLTGQDNS